MKQQDKTKLGRRDFLGAMGAGLAATAARPPPPNRTPKRRRPATSQTRPTCKASTKSIVIQAEGDAAVLIRRTERQTRRSNLAATVGNQAAGGLDRRSFLRKSGLVASGTAAVAARPAPAPIARRKSRRPNFVLSCCFIAVPSLNSFSCPLTCLRPADRKLPFRCP